MKIDILIPAFNEEKNIQKTLKGLENFNNNFCKEHGLDMEVLVIDDGSIDKTQEKAKEMGAKVLKLKENKGKGNALDKGLKESTGQIVVFLDADLKESSYEVYKLVLPIIENKADVVIAKFKPTKKKGGFGFVKSLAFYGVKLYTGKEVTTALSGQRAFKREVLQNIGKIPDGFGLEVGMLIDILQKGYLVKEVEVNMDHDVTGRNIRGFVHRGKQFFDILKVLLPKLRKQDSVN